MKAVTGVLSTRAEAERMVHNLETIGVPRDRVIVLYPGDVQAAESVPVSPAEQPGMGKAIGGVVGAAFGAAGGIHAGAAIAAATVPGVGPVIALGTLGAAVLGAVGAGAGSAAGGALENATTQGLPEDELFVYLDALRQGRSVVIALGENDAAAQAIRELFQSEGAESVYAARQQWWIGLRSAEEESYMAAGRDFHSDEPFYRLGFEAALHARNRCKEYDQILLKMAVQIEELKLRHSSAHVEDAFRQGYERGRAYLEDWCNRQQAA